MRTAFIKSGSRQNWFINFFESNESAIFNLNSNLLTHCSWTSLSFYLFLSLPCFKSFFPSRLLPFFIFFSHPSHFLLHLTRLLTAFFFFFFFFCKVLRFSVKPIMIQVLKLIWNCTSYRKPAKNKDDIFTKLKKQNRRNDSNGKRCAAKLKNRRERFMCYRWDKYWCKPCSKRFCFQKEMQPEIGNTASNNKFRKAAFHISIKQNLSVF